MPIIFREGITVFETNVPQWPTFIDVSLKFNGRVSQKKYTKLIKRNLKLITKIICREGITVVQTSFSHGPTFIVFP